MICDTEQLHLTSTLLTAVQFPFMLIMHLVESTFLFMTFRVSLIPSLILIQGASTNLHHRCACSHLMSYILFYLLGRASNTARHNFILILQVYSQTHLQSTIYISICKYTYKSSNNHSVPHTTYFLTMAIPTP